MGHPCRSRGNIRDHYASKQCCALFIGLLTWSRGITSIEEYRTTASVSTRLEIVYVQGCLFELAVPRPAMTGSPGPSAAAAPVTLNLAHYPAADHVTAADRPPHNGSAAIRSTS